MTQQSCPFAMTTNAHASFPHPRAAPASALCVDAAHTERARKS
jgi:hypothetical protein